jgi:GT2 family glycosyltransferase
MPVRNEAAELEQTLASVLGQAFDGEFEVIVADGRSTDETRELIRRKAMEDVRVQLVDNPHGGIAQGLNAALAAARGRYVVRVDGHARVPRDFLQKLVGHLRSGACEAAGGRIRGVGTTPFGRAVAAANDSPFGIGNAKHHYSERLEFVDHVPFGAYVTERARAIGGWDVRFVKNQDFEFDYRYGLAGGRVLLDPSVVSEWRIRETPRALRRQYFSYGYWRLRSLVHHPESLRIRWLAAPTLVAALAVGTATVPTAAGRRLLGLTAGSYAAFLGVASRRLSAKDSGVAARHIVAALATMHLSWGSGVLVSAGRFASAKLRRTSTGATRSAPTRRSSAGGLPPRSSAES